LRLKTWRWSAETGSGTILGVGIVIALLELAIACSVAIGSARSEQQLAIAAESGALAASDALNGFSTGFPCEAAKAVIEQNRSKLAECRIVRFEVFVSAQDKVLGMVHFASATAGNPRVAQSRE
jgi:secretion/DNA translocation related TadE-like protein